MMINLFVFTGRVASSVKFKYRENGGLLLFKPTDLKATLTDKVPMHASKIVYLQPP